MKCNMDEKLIVMNYITEDPITLVYCLVQALYSLQEVPDEMIQDWCLL